MFNENEYHRAWRRANPEKEREYRRRSSQKQKERNRAWRLANPDKIKKYDCKSYRKHRLTRPEADKKYRAENPEKVKAYNARTETKAIQAAAARRYKAKQNGWAECTDYPLPPSDSKCAICHREDALCLDHDHETGKFRGYLCQNCNMALGKLGDTVEAIRRVLAYLERGNG
jgi:hypothetical protein